MPLEDTAFGLEPDSFELSDLDSTPRLDRETLGSLAELGQRRGKDLLTQLFGIFRDQGPAGIESMRQSLADGDTASLRETAHSLKGSYRSLGTPRLARLAEALENLGRAERLQGCAALVDALEREFRSTSDALGQFVEAQAGSTDSTP